MTTTAPDVEAIEIDVVLEAIHRRYGYDFRNYARASLKRRLEMRVRRERLDHISDLLPRVMHDERFFEDLITDLSVTVTAMFRDPGFFAALRTDVVPTLRTYPFLKIWQAGCATGEEVYSLAIVLEEEGLLNRAQIYATDINAQSLDHARKGIYSLKSVLQHAENYRASQPKATFSDYFCAQYDSAKMSDRLAASITWAHHNLVVDGVFGEMNLILCRNVLIYFDADLQDRVLHLFRNSLCHRGFLCLGPRESLAFSSVEHQFESIDGDLRVFRRR